MNRIAGAESKSQPERVERLHPAWAVALLLWMWVGFGVYVFKILFLPGRADRLLERLRSLLG